MEEGHVVHTFHKNEQEEIRFTLREYKERHYFDLRLWFLPENGEEYRPSKKGLTLAVEFLPEMKKGLERVGKAASELPLQKPANSLQ